VRVDLKLEVPVEVTPRVVQLCGIFDVPEKKLAGVEFHFDVPVEQKPWRIGLITGPSGAGKTSVARHLFGDAIVAGYDWHPAKSVVDSFGELPVRDVTAALSSVGFSSPPSWIKPFRVLSNGEQFRATMARALLDPRPLVVVDEFTSVVDRTVARIGAHALAKAVRARPGRQFVAVTCHDDVTEWLQPDWVLEPHVGKFDWRCLRRRPEVELEIVRCRYEAWRWFAPHHYLTATLARSARCFAGLVEGRPAAFAALLHFPHPRVRDIVSLSRLVVHPDFQGLGLGAHAFTETIGAICRTNGKRMSTHPSHPALVRTWAKSPKWKMTQAPGFTGLSGKSTLPGLAKTAAVHRRVAHFQYVGPGLEGDAADAARRLWAA
jgi:ABC-type thiamine transport system ATPase subunit